MITRQIVETIKKRRTDGITDEQIHAILKNSGHEDEEIAEAIRASYDEDISYLPDEESAREQKTKKKGWWPF